MPGDLAEHRVAVGIHVRMGGLDRLPLIYIRLAREGVETGCVAEARGSYQNVVGPRAAIREDEAGIDQHLRACILLLVTEVCDETQIECVARLEIQLST